MQTEKPILFSAPMVRAILAGRKTRTRRVVRLRDGWAVRPYRPADRVLWQVQDSDGERARCPFGGVGLTLWVRETWRPSVVSAATDRENRTCTVTYAADETTRTHRVGEDTGWRMVAMMLDKPVGQWRPSIFMPRWASRLTLRVTSVGVERLQDITRAESRAEGVETLDEYEDYLERAGAIGVGSGDAEVKVFGALWDGLNGKRPGCAWADDPWVWVVGFERVGVRDAE
jgi:hypothetical protein